MCAVHSHPTLADLPRPLFYVPIVSEAVGFTQASLFLVDVIKGIPWRGPTPEKIPLALAAIVNLREGNGLGTLTAIGCTLIIHEAVNSIVKGMIH